MAEPSAPIVIRIEASATLLAYAADRGGPSQQTLEAEMGRLAFNAAAKVAAERASADNIVRAEVFDENTAPEDRRIPEPDDEAT